jgi:hypothetical protein
MSSAVVSDQVGQESSITRYHVRPATGRCTCMLLTLRRLGHSDLSVVCYGFYIQLTVGLHDVW